MKHWFDSIRIRLARLICPSTHEVKELTLTPDPKDWMRWHYPDLYVARKPGKRNAAYHPTTLGGLGPEPTAQEIADVAARDQAFQVTTDPAGPGPRIDPDFIRRGREQWGPIRKPWPEDAGVSQEEKTSLSGEVKP